MSSTLRWLNGLNFQEAPHTLSDETLQDLITLHTLPLRTRLDDSAWLTSSLEKVCIKCETQYSILQRGHDIAKQCVWDFLKTHKPSICAAKFPEGWPEVRFGWLELVRSFGQYRSASDHENFAFRQNCPDRTSSLIFDITRLRIAVCHFSSCELHFIDDCLKTVQQLAIQLYDEKRAFAIRNLRDELRQAAEETVEEVQMLEPLVLLPLAGYLWEDHHAAMFRYATCRATFHGYRALPQPIMRVAATWSPWLHGPRRDPGDVEAEDKAVEPEEEQQQQQSRSLERRHSICAMTRHLDVHRGVCDRGRGRRASIGVVMRRRADVPELDA